MSEKNFSQVIFLDVDGVLNSQRSLLAFGGWPNVGKKNSWDRMDDVAVRLIRGLSGAANAPIVMSSAWRVGDNWKLFAEKFNLNIIDKTGQESGKRGDQIKAWLERNPHVNNYAIIDDSTDMLVEQLPYFVMVNPEDGLRVKDMVIAAKILKIELNGIRVTNKSQN